MESEERDRSKIEYAERRISGVFEVMAYSGSATVQEDIYERIHRPYSDIPRYKRVLIIPLPPDFDWEKVDHGVSLPNSILITEDSERWKTKKGRKRIRPLTAFLRKPGRTSIKEVRIIGEIRSIGKCWLSKEKFLAITKRNLYVDQFYADQIFNRK